MDLGDALYRAICKRSSNTEPKSTGDAIRWFVKQAGGNVSAAAALAGVPRRSMRDYVSGVSSPKSDRAAGLLAAAVRGERRKRLRPGREKRLRQLDPTGIELVAQYNYDRKEEPRKVQIGQYVDPDVMHDLLDAFLAGESTDVLREVFAEGIADAPFYHDTLRNPETDDHGWSIDEINWEGDGE